ncbi:MULTISPECIES: tyrosine-type recombinase/integrase [Shewanella]|jgi:integrase|uniref:tyrosine-type recombinase/integrase n=1 Tax=Shewanella TaxID=22 RepID=UPI000CA8B098|nr:MULTISPECIES: tyrosine-type recombinase/integrase [Shewanella]MBB1364078.1 tyrosine-type recombinase/integrase [Shewanella sp. SR44-4]MBB1391246.1 tyrosine-type recombinase/integrase [Shewanella sp. SG44-6]PIX72183.1 MAG: integrase [Shewanella sp. CG_4_10_14_3_um_filter_42_91]PIY65053.1 MAG: integrase [Shewanella sp. CG_4_10_14_0_8_um_filter_42_13]RPA30790.1 integrase [Shewanella frigidimarina]|tara:strand:- start:452 stop:1048 length:597 start_codon:yes stop_codon:yes gene_type:complete
MVSSNKKNHSGVKKPFRLEEIWRIRTRLEIENSLMQLALLNLAIDSKLRASDLLPLRVCDISSQERMFARVKLIQQKTDVEVQFEVTARTQQSLMKWIFVAALKTSDYLFPSLIRNEQPISYSYYRSLVRSWASNIGLDPNLYGTHSMRRTKATLVYAKTKDIRAVQLLLGHTRVDNTIRYLGVELEDALTLSESTDC